MEATTQTARGGAGGSTFTQGNNLSYLEGIPRFGSSTNYEKLKEWQFKVEVTKDSFGLSDKKLLFGLVNRLEGNCFQLIKRLMETNPRISWEEVKNELRRITGSQDQEWRILGELEKWNLLKAGNNIDRYLDKFKYLTARASNLTEGMKVYRGQPPQVEASVRSHQHQSITDAIKTARVVYECEIRSRLERSTTPISNKYYSPKPKDNVNFNKFKKPG